MAERSAQSGANILYELYQNAREDRKFDSIEQDVKKNLSWLTTIPPDRKWTILHQIVFHGKVEQLNRLLALQIDNAEFDLRTKTSENETVLEIAQKNQDTNETMYKHIRQLLEMDELLKNAAKSNWRTCRQVLSRTPDIVNEKPPYSKFYFVHYLVRAGDRQVFDQFYRDYTLDLTLHTHAGKSVVDVAREAGHNDFADYLQQLVSDLSIYYRVQSGETLATIAQQKGFSLDQMKAANPELEGIDRLAVDQVIKLPRVQKLIDSKIEVEPRVSSTSVTVFQHFDGKHAESSLIPTNASEKNLSVACEKLKVTFMRYAHNQDGYMSLEEFQQFLTGLHLEMTNREASELFTEISQLQSGRLMFQDFFRYYENIVKGEPTQITQAQIDLLKAFLRADREGKCELGGISQFINQRWQSFNNFKRDGTTGKLVMFGGAEAQDVLPGEYSLVDLITWSDIVPQSVPPRMTKVQNIQWIRSSDLMSGSGRLVFPKGFVDVCLSVELATNEKLAYYGCCFANESQMKVSLLHRHAIQDFTYLDNYYRDFVKGRAGLERHEFAHLDCPFEEDSGFFVLGKLSEQNATELHLTAFKIPVRYTLYVPPFVIHSNDYLKGRWRTMLSDATPIDHVRLERERYDGEIDQISFDFAN